MVVMWTIICIQAHSLLVNIVRCGSHIYDVMAKHGSNNQIQGSLDVQQIRHWPQHWHFSKEVSLGL